MHQTLLHRSPAATMQPMLALLRTFSWQDLRHHPWRSAAAVAAVMLGVALAFAVHVINASALDEFSRLRMRVELKRLQNDLGITFIHVTHTQPEAIALADKVIVMDHGIIEQAAHPKEIYDHPHSPYVARFMGGQNVVSGRLESVSGELAAARGAEGGLFMVPLRAPAQPGADLRFAVRRDKIALEPGGKGGENAIAGRVTNVEYQGTFVKVELATAQKEEFVVTLSDRAFFARPFDFGDALVASWQPEDVCHLIGGNNSAGDALAH